MSRQHDHHISHGPVVGLGRVMMPLFLNALTAPTERVKLLLQSQDEIILNLREESSALYHHHHHHHQQNSCQSSSIPPSPDCQLLLRTQKQEQEQPQESPKNERLDTIDHAEDNDDNDEEPRSILVPYAQLPFTDAQDCFQRLVEKEGPLSLWRGYSLEFIGSMALTRVEHVLQRCRFLDFRVHGSPGDLGGAKWLLSSALHGTAVSGIALLAVYPLAVLKAKMATDLVRRVKHVRKTIVAQVNTAPTSSIASPSEQDGIPLDKSKDTSVNDGEAQFDEEDQHESGVLVSREDSSSQEPDTISATTSLVSEQEGAIEFTSTPLSNSSVLVEYEYELAYKFTHIRDALNDILDAEGYRGLYKGFSPILLGTLISRLGYMTLSRVLTPLLTRPGNGALSRGGFVGGLCGFLLVFMSSSLIQFVVYPLGTIGHRRMIAHKGRYKDSCDAATKIVSRSADEDAGVEEGWRSLFKGFEAALIRSAVLAVLSRAF
ncbi:hypothetical protein BGZ83_008864 [Gryganskiella cystojenkinii]|nr:hypothetical protein BGZ83_008864 [Gryganskiella cystojenkinii]